MSIQISGSTVIDNNKQFFGDMANRNFFVGGAGNTTTTGTNNFFIGLCAGYCNTAGSCNNFIGCCAGRSNLTGSNNNFMGRYAGRSNTTGSNNNFFGDSAGQFSTTGCNNNFFGDGAGCRNTAGCNNNFFGGGAGGYNTTGCHNNFFGDGAGCNNTTGINNNFFGDGAGYCNTTGCHNNFFGLGAGYCNITGCYNNYIGRAAGFSATGSRNVVLGGNARQTSTTTISNEVTIDSGTNFARFQGAATAWTFTSDQRDKANIIDLPLGSEFLAKIKPRKFDWNFRHTDNNKGDPASGFIAQEVLEVIQEFDADYTGIVNTNDPNQYTLGSASLIPVMVNAIKELMQEVEDLKERVSVLE